MSYKEGSQTRRVDISEVSVVHSLEFGTLAKRRPQPQADAHLIIHRLSSIFFICITNTNSLSCLALVIHYLANFLYFQKLIK